MDRTVLSTRVKYLCTKQGMTLKKLAERMEIKPESLSRAINGNPQLSTLENIAKALEVDVADLFGEGRTPDSASASEFIAVVVDHGESFIFHEFNGLIDWVNKKCE